MRTLTMVMRSGVKNAPANQFGYILIADDYSFVRMTGAELEKALHGKKVLVTNLGFDPVKGLVATNGAMDKYTLINQTTGEVDGKASPVVLNRAEADGKLLGYTIFSTAGVLQEVDVATALKIHAVTPFSNGKVRHTKDGDIIQSIEGNYPVRAIAIQKAQVGKIKIDIVFIGSAIGKIGLGGKSTRTEKYAGIIINAENAADLSRVYAKLPIENKKLVTSLSEMDNAKKLDTLAIKRTDSTGIYGVFPIEVVFDLIAKAGNKVSNRYGRIMVACTDYSADEESLVIFDTALNVENKQAGTEQSERALKAYLGDILPKLKAITIEK